jgi:integrase
MKCTSYFFSPPKLEKLDVRYEEKSANKPMQELLCEQVVRYEIAYTNKAISYSTLKAYNGAIKQHLIPYFGNMLINDVKVQDIEEFVASRNLSKKRIVIILTPFRVVIKRAKRNGVIKTNPLDELAHEELKLYYKHSEYQIEPFNSTEKEAIIGASSGQTRNLIQFGFWTGMRVGEMFALKWADIDFNKEVVFVTKTKSLNGIIKEPKTKAGIREVELTSMALDALNSQFEYTGQFNDMVFHNPVTNRPWSTTNAFRRHWEKILEAACINYRNPHQMRHTFISFMLMMGNRPEVLYKIVGHQNTEMIYKIYGKFIKGENHNKLLVIGG